MLTAEAKFVRWFSWGAWIVFAMLSLGRAITITKYLTWSEGSGVYEGAKTVSSGRSGGAMSCERSYRLAPQPEHATPETDAAPPIATVDSPCLVLIGPRPAIGERIPLRVHPTNPQLAMSSVEAFGIGIFELFPLVVLLAAHLVQKGMRKRGKWFVHPPTSE